MKNITKYILSAIVVAGALSLVQSCDYLKVDKYFKDMQNEDKIVNDRRYSAQWLAFCYQQLTNGNMEVGDPSRCPQNYSDDQVFSEDYDSYKKFKLGQIDYSGSSDFFYSDSWSSAYAGIYQASKIIGKIDDSKELSDNERLDIKGQARFLRAYFYWILLRRYGPVPIMPKDGADYTLKYDELCYPRSTYEECVDFIADEMAQAASELPIKRDNLNMARPTKGAALAVRAKAYLYGASPLANGNPEMSDFTDNKGKQLISPSYDEEKWAKAAAAARDVIEGGWYRLYTAPKVENSSDIANPSTIVPPFNAEYSSKNFPDGWADIDPFESYRNVFNGSLKLFNNPEIIFSRANNVKHDAAKMSNVTLCQLPVSIGGRNCHAMTLTQCDAYDMADGSAFKRKSVYGYVNDKNAADHPYDHLEKGVSLEYANREPRFYASVAYNGSVWNCKSAMGNGSEHIINKQVWYYRETSDGCSSGSYNWLVTGIGIKKYVDPSDCAAYGGSVREKAEPALRYADILLCYAEALNNLTTSYEIPSWDGSTTYTVSRDIDEMRRGIKPVRMRAGVPDYSDATYSSVDAMFKAIVHERQVELFAESQRYYDVRRWMIAPQTEGAEVKGYNIMMNEASRDDFYRPIRVAEVQTSFSRKQYFWPITYDELRRNKNLTQAPGWLDFD